MHAYASEARYRTSALGVLAVVAVALAFGLGEVLEALQVSPPWWMDTPAVLGLYGALYRLYDRSAWRWRLGPMRLSDIPDLAGTWDVELVSDHDPSTTLHAELRIRQTWSSICVELRSERSRSWSTMASVDGADARDPGLHYSYVSEPDALADGLAMHRGSVRLCFDGDDTLKGSYHAGAGRRTAGTMTMVRRGAPTGRAPAVVGA